MLRLSLLQGLQNASTYVYHCIYVTWFNTYFIIHFRRLFSSGILFPACEYSTLSTSPETFVNGDALTTGASAKGSIYIRVVFSGWEPARLKYHRIYIGSRTLVFRLHVFAVCTAIPLPFFMWQKTIWLCTLSSEIQKRSPERRTLCREDGGTRITAAPA